MKKLLLMLLFFATTIYSQTVTYQPSTAVISNPERGFYHYTSTGSSSGYNLLNQSTLRGYRTNENITVIQRQFFLRDFITGIPITSTYLTNMQTDFNRIRNAGAKVVVRFTYTSSSSYTVFQPTKVQILAHIQQLKTVVNANKDVIVSIQAGFIGKYGEWYYTGSNEFGTGNYTALTTTQWNNRKEVMDAMINKFPIEIPLQVRYVYAKQKMYGNTYIGRISFYNDSFLGTYGDSGTFNVSNAQSQPSTADVAYWQNATINLPVSGETNMTNGTRTNCTNAMLEMNKFNWSLINKDYYPAVISNWQTNGCFTTMQQNLGYNFRLNTSNITNNVLTINIGNYGYANLFKDRKAFLICKNTITNVDYSFLVDNNFKNCINTNYNISVNLSTLSLPIGTYKMYLNLPDPNSSLSNNTLYSIRTSNLNTWISTSGYNDLLQTWVKQSSVVAIYVEKDIIRIDNLRNYRFKLYDISGNLLEHNSLDISDLKQGIYIIKVEDDTEKTYTEKIIKT